MAISILGSRLVRNSQLTKLQIELYLVPSSTTSWRAAAAQRGRKDPSNGGELWLDQPSCITVSSPPPPPLSLWWSTVSTHWYSDHWRGLTTCSCRRRDSPSQRMTWRKFICINTMWWILSLGLVKSLKLVLNFTKPLPSSRKLHPLFYYASSKMVVLLSPKSPSKPATAVTYTTDLHSVDLHSVSTNLVIPIRIFCSVYESSLAEAMLGEKLTHVCSNSFDTTACPSSKKSNVEALKSPSPFSRWTECDEPKFT